jgi:2-polyprenyl-3-methyl-5-hydroxy-6-metoxy-1,4-benzoquinol methylase
MQNEINHNYHNHTQIVFDDSVIPFLKGDVFDNGLKVRIAKKNRFISRIEFICKYAAGKKILHIGCTDHIPVIKEKNQLRTWLHSRINEVAAEQIGIDISEESIDFVKNELGYSNMLCMDIVNDGVPEVIKSKQWDAIIMGELLEHIDNPVDFLTKLREKYKPYAGELVITVPNALSLSNFYYIITNKERINTDHRYWFTPYTLSKILLRAGYKPLYHEFASYYELNRRKPLRNFFLRQLLVHRPGLRGNLIMVAKL